MRTSFVEGDEFEVGGLKVTATYSDNSKEVLDALSYTVDSSKVNMNVAGSYEVKVTYETASATYNITVAAKEVPSSSSSEPVSSSELPSSSETPISSSETPISSEIPASSEAPALSSEGANSSSNEGRTKKGCGGSIVACSAALMSMLAVVGIVLLKSKKND